MASITLEYKRSAEYQIWRSHILAEAPQLPEYLVDMCIAFHLESPLAYRDKKLHRPQPTPPKVPSLVDVPGAVRIMDPEELEQLPSVKIVSH